MANLSPVEELDLKHEVNQINVAFKGLADLVGDALLQNKAMKASIKELEKRFGDMQLLLLSLDKNSFSTTVPATSADENAGPKDFVCKAEEGCQATPPLKWGTKVAKTSQGPSPTQALIGAYRKEEGTTSSKKKLFNSPDQAQKAANTPNESATKSMTPVGVIKAQPSATGETLPEGILSNFPPTGDMILLRSEVILACYVFHPDLDAMEVLLRIGNMKVNRLELHCFCPGMEISPEVITLLTMKTTHNQHHATFQTVWALPPVFMDDVLDGHTINELSCTYADIWMKPMDYLNYVYVPIRDEQGHWFLMVINLEDEAVYHLDSYVGHMDILKRKETIRIVTAVISDIVTTGTYSRNLTHIASKFKTWEVKEPTGIPNRGKSDDSAVYVMDWLQMEADFNPLITCDLNIAKTRMNTLLKLLTGYHNEERLAVILKSNSYWKFIRSQMA